MASSSLRPKPNNYSPRTAIRFFKIILRKNLKDGNLKIPNKFTRKYGGGVPNPVYLKPPDGTEWKVEWTKHDGGILFEKGWKEFATYYSLDNGHLLWFEYNGTPYFKVHIGDMSGLEIDYPFHDQISDDESVEILNEPLQRRRGRPKKILRAPIPSPSTSRILRSGIISRDVERSSKTQNLTQHVKNEGSKSEDTYLEMPIIASANRNLDVLEEANKFKSENPSFIVKIGQVNVKGTPSFPIFFFRKYFKNMKQLVKLRFGKKFWPAKLICYPFKSKAIISAGWRLFARANKLKAGDFCIFELINREDPVLDVHLYRDHGNAIHQNFRASSTK